jgi:hypothetical protein
MSINRNFKVNQSIQVGTNLTVGNTFTSNAYFSNKADVVASPSMMLDFSKGRIDSRLQAWRTSNATYVSANGKIVEVGTHVPRVEWNPTTGACLGLVCEEYRLNGSPYSDVEGLIGAQPRGMNYAPSDGQSCVVSTDQWIGPNKLSCKHTRGTGADSNVGYYNWPTTMIVNMMYAMSCYVYIPSNTNIAYCGISNESGSSTFDNVAGGVADLNVRDRWQRLVLTSRCASSTGGTACVLRTEPTGAVVYSDCWQIEQGEYASTWIPTTNVINNYRDNEYVYLSPIPASIGFSDKSFSVVAEVAPKWSANALMYTANNALNVANPNRGFISFDYNAAETGFGYEAYNGYGLSMQPGSATNSLYLFARDLVPRGTSGFWTSGNNPSNVVTNSGYNYNTWVANTVTKVGMTFDTTMNRLCINGDATTIANNGNMASLYSSNNNINRIRLGQQNQGGAGTLFGGNIRKVSFFPRALSNTELIALTET